MPKSLLKKTSQNHSLAMILCCAIPLGLFVILSFTGSLGSWSYYGLLLLCPLLHVLMMRGHRWTSDHIHAHAESEGEAKRLIVSPNKEKGLHLNKKDSTPDVQP